MIVGWRLSLLAALAVCLGLIPYCLAAGERSSFDSRMAEAGELYRDERYAEAEAILRDLKAETEPSSQTDPRHAEAVNNLAEVLSAEGRYEEAEQLYNTALPLRVKLLGPTANDVATTCVGLAEVYRAQQRDPEALQLLRRALKIAIHYQGPLILAGEFRQDERFLNSILQDPSSVPGSPHVALVLTSLGRYYQDHGQYDMAQRLFKKVVDIYGVPPDKDVSRLYRKPWEGSADLAGGLLDLADSLSLQGKPAESESIYKRALSLTEQQRGSGHPATARVLGKLAKLYRSEGRTAEADELDARARSMTSRVGR